MVSIFNYKQCKIVMIRLIESVSRVKWIFFGEWGMEGEFLFEFRKNSHSLKPTQLFLNSLNAQMSPTSKTPPGPHSHELAVPYNVFKEKLLKGKVILVSTIQRQGHTHTLRLKYVKATKK